MPPAEHQPRQHAEHQVHWDVDPQGERRVHRGQDEPIEQGEEQSKRDWSDEPADTDLPSPRNFVCQCQACAQSDGICETRHADASQPQADCKGPVRPDHSINCRGCQQEDMGERSCEHQCPRNGATVLHALRDKFSDLVPYNQFEFLNSSEPSCEFAFNELAVRLDLTLCQVHSESSELLQQHLSVFHVRLAELPQEKPRDRVDCKKTHAGKYHKHPRYLQRSRHVLQNPSQVHLRKHEGRSQDYSRRGGCEMEAEQ
mmetsp:Transcript_82006/g.264721  ORF Transcript_82006/g.264721 Transcript_82006/m.264721 type:complete len:257 (-) Transcript_82006:974-1744(-)